MSFWGMISQKSVGNVFLAIVVLLGFATPPRLKCNSVAVVGIPGPFYHVSQKVRVTVTIHGVPMEGATVEVSRWKRREVVATLHTDFTGLAEIPVLPPGTYTIGAFSTEHPGSGHGLTICVAPCTDNPYELSRFVVKDLNGHLESLDELPEKPTEFTLEIGHIPSPIFPSMLAAAEGEPHPISMPELRGVVKDQSGAVVRGAAVEIVIKGTQGKKRAATLWTDKAGTFTAKLAAGIYIAFVSAPGFQTKSVPFAVNEKGQSRELRVVLVIASVTQSITLAEN